MPRIYTHSVDSDAKNVKSVALFAIQPAESWTKALGQCWRTRQWDIVPHPTDPMETSLLQDQHPAMHPGIFVNPFITFWPKIKSFQDAWTCWSTWYSSISLNWCILPWIIERYIFKMGWSIVQIFLINSYSYNYIILIPLFFYRKSHSRRQVQHRVRDMQDRCQSKG